MHRAIASVFETVGQNFLSLDGLSEPSAYDCPTNEPSNNNSAGEEEWRGRNRGPFRLRQGRPKTSIKHRVCRLNRLGPFTDRLNKRSGPRPPSR
jgi:hypothetical protein